MAVIIDWKNDNNNKFNTNNNDNTLKNYDNEFKHDKNALSSNDRTMIVIL